MTFSVHLILLFDSAVISKHLECYLVAAVVAMDVGVSAALEYV